MKQGWERIGLGEICEVLDSQRKPITKRNRTEGDIPYYGATGIVDWVKDYLFDEPLILLGEDGAKWDSGDESAFKIDGKTWVNNHAHVLRPLREKVMDNWLIYYLNFQNLQSYVTGLTVPKLNQGNMRKIPIPIPHLDEQKHIVAKLDKCFEAIDKARANVEKNLNNAKELFQSQLNQIFSQKGEGWVEKKLREVFTIRPKKNEAKELLSDEDMVTFLPMADLKELQKEIKPHQQKQLNKVYSGYTYFAEDDLLLAKITPCFENGKLGIAKNLVNGIGFGSSEYIVFRFKSEVVPEYLFYYLSREYFRIEGVNAMMGAVGHKRVAKEFIENYLIIYPTIEIQEKIVQQLDALKSHTQALESNYQQELDALDELKKSILQKAFNGEL